VKCPECGSINVVYEDESFDHAFGTEINRYYFCENCDWQENADEFEHACQFSKNQQVNNNDKN